MNLARPEVAPCGRCLVAFVAEISQCRDAATAPIVTKWGGNRLTTMARRIGLVRQMERCTHLHTVRVGVCAGSAPRDPDWTRRAGWVAGGTCKMFPLDLRTPVTQVHRRWALRCSACSSPLGKGSGPLRTTDQPSGHGHDASSAFTHLLTTPALRAGSSASGVG